MGQTDHRLAMEAFRQYLVVGGMPQSVEAFANGRLKHKVRAIWNNIPGALSAQEKHFKPGLVKEGVKMRDLDSPF